MNFFKIITIFLAFAAQTDAKPTMDRKLSKDQIARLTTNDLMTQLLAIKYKQEATKRAAQKTNYRKNKLVCHYFFYKMIQICN